MSINYIKPKVMTKEYRVRQGKTSFKILLDYDYFGGGDVIMLADKSCVTIEYNQWLARQLQRLWNGTKKLITLIHAFLLKLTKNG